MAGSMSQLQLSARRVAQNQARFREANERIEQAAVEYAVDGSLPFICECSDPNCVEILRLKLPDYEAVRATPHHFVCAPGHHQAAEGWSSVVDRRDGYEVVEKVGDAATVAEVLDPRSE
jgi:hypothetical protein